MKASGGFKRVEKTTRKSLLPPSLTFPRGQHSREPDDFIDDCFTFFVRGAVGSCLKIDFHEDTEPFTVILDSGIARPPKKHGGERKPHLIRLIVELAAECRLDQVLIPLDAKSTMRVIAVDGERCPARTFLETYYKRPPKSDRIVNRIYFFNEPPYCDPNAALLRYRQLYGVDTNTVLHSGGKRLSITSVCSCSFLPGSGPFLCDAQMQELGCALNYNVSQPEQLAWLGMIRRLRREQGEDHTGRQGLIVDAHLKNIGPYNQRLVPIVGNLVLPHGFDLIFATSDSGLDQFASNKVMGICDSYSKRAWKKLRSMSEEQIDEQVRAGPYLVEVGDRSPAWWP